MTVLCWDDLCVSSDRPACGWLSEDGSFWSFWKDRGCIPILTRNGPIRLSTNNNFCKQTISKLVEYLFTHFWSSFTGRVLINNKSVAFVKKTEMFRFQTRERDDVGIAISTWWKRYHNYIKYSSFIWMDAFFFTPMSLKYLKITMNRIPHPGGHYNLKLYQDPQFKHFHFFYLVIFIFVAVVHLLF